MTTTRPLASSWGVPQSRLAWSLGGFTAYGVVVHDLTDRGRLLHLGSLGSALLVGASAARALRPRS